MTIGAHITGENIEQNLLLAALKKIATYNASIKIILFTEKKVRSLPNNFVQVEIMPRPKNKLLLYYWFNYKLPKLLVAHQVNSFISNEGLPVSNITARQFLFIDNTSLLKERKLFFKKQFALAVLNAENIFVTNDFIATVLSNKFELAASKIKSLYFNVKSIYKPFTFDAIEATKETYTEGFDYFLFPVNSVSAQQLLLLLKAFSQLKKWQKTTMKMLLLFESEIEEKLVPDFKNYKYRNDVKLIKQTAENYESIIAAAFTFIFFGEYKNIGSVYDAFYYNVPVIAAQTKVNELLFATAVSYTALKEADVALQLQLIYKNESYKQNLTQLATSYLEKYDSNTASQNLYEVVSN